MAAEPDAQDQALRIELMGATLDKIRFDIAEAQRAHDERKEQWKRDDVARAEREKREARRFWASWAITVVAVVGTWYGIFLHSH
jgi:hypothetical protein